MHDTHIHIIRVLRLNNALSRNNNIGNAFLTQWHNDRYDGDDGDDDADEEASSFEVVLLNNHIASSLSLFFMITTDADKRLNKSLCLTYIFNTHLFSQHTRLWVCTCFYQPVLATATRLARLRVPTFGAYEFMLRTQIVRAHANKLGAAAHAKICQPWTAHTSLCTRCVAYVVCAYICLSRMLRWLVLRTFVIRKWIMLHLLNDEEHDVYVAV